MLSGSYITGVRLLSFLNLLNTELENAPWSAGGPRGLERLKVWCDGNSISSTNIDMWLLYEYTLAYVLVWVLNVCFNALVHSENVLCH